MNRKTEPEPGSKLDAQAFTRLAIHSTRMKEGMEGLVSALRSFMIFDNLVVYAIDSDAENLDVVYARALGRGKSAGPDASWGEDFAGQVMQAQKTLLRVTSDDQTNDRLKQVHLLGLPLRTREELEGALIFIRFGGPEYKDKDIQLAEFMATQVAALVKIHKMERQIQSLEVQNQAAQLQEDFINTITHELRSPLGFIKGYTTTLLRADTDWNDKTQKEFLSIIDQETDNLQDLIGNLLDSARLQSGQLPMDFQAVRLDSIMNGVVQRIRPGRFAAVGPGFRKPSGQCCEVRAGFGCDHHHPSGKGRRCSLLAGFRSGNRPGIPSPSIRAILPSSIPCPLRTRVWSWPVHLQTDPGCARRGDFSGIRVGAGHHLPRLAAISGRFMNLLIPK
jgi:hypothetical protein